MAATWAALLSAAVTCTPSSAAIAVNPGPDRLPAFALTPALALAPALVEFTPGVVPARVLLVPAPALETHSEPTPSLELAPTPASKLAPDPSARHHDGFYLRWGIGPCYMLDSVDSSEVGAARFEGVGITNELLIGGTPAPGLVIGGGTHGANVFLPSLEIEGSSADAPDLISLSALGAFVDYYFDPHAGWHAQAYAGVGLLAADTSSFREDPLGFVLALGAGHDFWVSSELSVGVLARISYARLRYARGAIEETHQPFVLGLLGTLTYH